MEEKIDSFKSLLIGTFKRAYFWGPPILLDPFDLYDKYIKNALPKNWQVDIIMPSDVGFALFVLMLVLAVFLTYHEERTKGLILKKKLEPKLTFIFHHRPPYEQIEDIGPSGNRRSWKFRVGVKNIGGTFLSSCWCSLEALSPNDGTWFSRPLKLAKDNPNDTLNLPHKQSFPLDPGQEEIIDIVHIDERQESMKICYAKEGHRDLNLRETLPKKDFCFTLRATTDTGSPYLDTYSLKFDPANNNINFAPLSEFASKNK